MVEGLKQKVQLIINHAKERTYRNWLRTPQIENATYVGTLGKVSYSHSWWGLGSVDSVMLTFKDNSTFIFNKDLLLELGLNYTVYYQIWTFPNSNDVIPMEIHPIDIIVESGEN